MSWCVPILKKMDFGCGSKKLYLRYPKKKSVFPFFEIFKTVNSVDEPLRSFRLFTGDLAKLSSAMFCLLGWQDSGFSNDLLTSDAKLIKFFRKHIDSQKIIWSADDSSSSLKDRQFILIVPALPKSENKALELYDFFRSIGVNGVLTLSSVLENLLRILMSMSTAEGIRPSTCSDY